MVDRRPRPKPDRSEHTTGERDTCGTPTQLGKIDLQLQECVGKLVPVPLMGLTTFACGGTKRRACVRPCGSRYAGLAWRGRNNARCLRFLLRQRSIAYKLILPGPTALVTMRYHTRFELRDELNTTEPPLAYMHQQRHSIRSLLRSSPSLPREAARHRATATPDIAT